MGDVRGTNMRSKGHSDSQLTKQKDWQIYDQTNVEYIEKRKTIQQNKIRLLKELTCEVS